MDKDDTARLANELAPPQYIHVEAYIQGFDCGMNGPDSMNSHYRLFFSPESTNIWQLGKSDGEAAKEVYDARNEDRF